MKFPNNTHEFRFLGRSFDSFTKAILPRPPCLPQMSTLGIRETSKCDIRKRLDLEETALGPNISSAILLGDLGQVTCTGYRQTLAGDKRVDGKDQQEATLPLSFSGAFSRVLSLLGDSHYPRECVPGSCHFYFSSLPLTAFLLWPIIVPPPVSCFTCPWL